MIINTTPIPFAPTKGGFEFTPTHAHALLGSFKSILFSRHRSKQPLNL
jgi:hypothetical protein